jgi:hypothetical protein
MPATLVPVPQYIPRVHPPRAASGERRRHPRLECPPVRVSGIRAIAQEVSRGGLGLHTGAALKVGQRIDIRLEDTMSRTSQEFQAVVVSVERERAGCRWVSPTAAQEAWLQDRLAGWFAALDGASRR